MKLQKLIAAGAASALLAGMLTMGTTAANRTPSLSVDGNAYRGTLYVSEGRIYVPLRQFCEDLGYEVQWDTSRSAAVVSGNGANASFYLGNGSVLRGASLYTQIRTLADRLGGKVQWNGKKDAANIEFPSAATYRSDELFWLARIVEAEAGGESMKGKIAVANTVLARVASPEFPNTIYGVIFDKKYAVQYEPVSNGTIYNNPSADSYDAARRALEGEEAVSNCLYFFNPAKASSSWIAKNRTYVTTIGNHVFYA